MRGRESCIAEQGCYKAGLQEETRTHEEREQPACEPITAQMESGVMGSVSTAESAACASNP